MQKGRLSMNKKDIINACIDMSYNVSKEEIENAIKEVTNQKYMETKMKVTLWKQLFEKMQNILNGENGSKYLFIGSNPEAYRQK